LGKWVHDADTRHGFTGIQAFTKKHVATCDMRGGNDQRIIKGDTACLVQSQRALASSWSKCLSPS
jgi:hypothetical protein